MSATTVHFTTADGLMLQGDLRGDPDAPPVLLLHGGGQTRHAWGSTAGALAERGWRTVSLDARGHGRSDWAPDGEYSLTAFASDLHDVISQLDGPPPALIGASLGGLTSLLLEGELWPGTARAIAFVDVAPQLSTAGTDRIRAFMDQPGGFASLEEAADAIAAYNPHRPRPHDLGGLEKNLRLGEDGRFRWHWDPAFIAGERGPAEISDLPRLQACARALRCPVLLVRGRMSDVLTEDGAREFLDLVPHARYADVSGAGHMVAGDRNDAFTTELVAFLDDLPGV